MTLGVGGSGYWNTWLELNGYNQTVGGLVCGNASGDMQTAVIENQTGTSTLTVNTAVSTSYAYNGYIRPYGGALNLVVAGSGSQTLAARIAPASPRSMAGS